SRLRPDTRSLSVRAMDRAKDAALHPQKSTTSLSRRPKPMPPSGRSPPLADLSDLNSTARKKPLFAVLEQLPLDETPPAQPRVGFHPDDTTPIPRPSHYYSRRHQSSMTELLQRDQADGKVQSAEAPPLSPAESKIDKSALALGEPKRL